MSFVLDSSVVAKLFFQEDGSGEAAKFLEICVHENVKLLGQELLLYEVGNVIWKKTRGTGVDGRPYMRQLGQLNIDFVPLDSQLMLQAMKLAQKKDISYYDAVHVALAETKGVPFITADRKLLELVPGAMTIEKALETLKTKL